MVANANGSLSRTLLVEAVSVPIDPAHFADWQQLTWPGITDINIIGSAKGPDRDCLTNLAEWALHLNPAAPDGFRPVLGESRGTLQYTYTRRKTAPAAANFRVEWSDTLRNDWAGPDECRPPHGERPVTSKY